MKTIHLILIATIISFVSAAQAQTISGAATIGINGCQVDGDTQSGYHKPGLKAGFSVSTPVEKTFGVESGLFFSSKGAIKRSQGYTEFKTKLNYAELPIIVKYRFLPKIGVDATISYNQQISSKIIDDLGTETKNPDYLKKYDITASIGLRFYLSLKYELTANFGYSLTKITDSPDMPYWRNNYINLSLIRRFAGNNSQK